MCQQNYLHSELGITPEEWENTPSRVRLVVQTQYALVQRLNGLVEEIVVLDQRLATQAKEPVVETTPLN